MAGTGGCPRASVDEAFSRRYLQAPRPGSPPRPRRGAGRSRQQQAPPRPQVDKAAEISEFHQAFQVPPAASGSRFQISSGWMMSLTVRKCRRNGTVCSSW